MRQRFTTSDNGPNVHVYNRQSTPQESSQVACRQRVATQPTGSTIAAKYQKAGKISCFVRFANRPLDANHCRTTRSAKGKHSPTPKHCRRTQKVRNIYNGLQCWPQETRRDKPRPSFFAPFCVSCGRTTLLPQAGRLCHYFFTGPPAVTISASPPFRVACGACRPLRGRGASSGALRCRRSWPRSSLAWHRRRRGRDGVGLSDRG